MEMKLFRNNEGKTSRYRIKNKNSREVVGIQNLLMQFEGKYLQCFGHMKRMI
jgi:hypothetical protein